MILFNVVWKEQFVEKLLNKHAITTDEIEEILFGRSIFRFWQKGKVKGENLYVAYGQTSSGRYVIVFFVLKYGDTALPISARDMTQKERKYYARRR